MNHYPHHIGDFMRDTAGLSMLEECAYHRLLEQYYSRELPLPLDRGEVYRLARVTSKQERQAVDYVIGRFFVQSDDGWHQKRADKELQAQRERSESARKSVSARWEKRNANAMPTEYERNTNVSETYDDRNTSHKPVASSQEPVVQKQDQGQDQKRVARKRAPAGKPATRPQKTPIPENFEISDRVRQWAEQNGHGRLIEHLASFRMKCQANAYAYADWDSAFMEAIRGNWARLGDSPPPGVSADPAMQRLTRVGQHSAESLNRWIDNEGVRNGTDGP